MVSTICVVLSNNQGEAAQAIAYAQRALDLLPEESLLQRSIVMRNLGAAYELQGQLAEAGQALTEAIALSRATDNLVTTLEALNNLARLEVEQAQLQRAAQLHRQALHAVETWARKQQQPDLRLPNAGLAYLGLADIHREWNELEAAHEFAATALELGLAWHVLDTVQVAYATLAWILQAQGDADGAVHAIQQASQAMHRASPRTSWVAAMQARLWLRRGDLAAAVQWAAHWAGRCELSPEAISRTYAHVPDEAGTLVRVRLAQGRVQAALALLEPMQAQAESTGRTGRVIETSLLHALACYAQGDVQAATAPLTRALSLAEPAGYVRLFVDEGAVMAKLLRLTKTRGVALNYIDELLAAFTEVEPAPSVPSPQRQGPSPLIEPLTKRERQVLRLLCTGLSNPEIAAELIVATGTVKKHLHNIYGKLSVRNRSQAILRTEELGLLQEESRD
jgi:LuxR family maltose regulon positive regulatory protein